MPVRRARSRPADARGRPGPGRPGQPGEVGARPSGSPGCWSCRPGTSGQDDFGLRLAEHRRLSTLGPLSLVLREEPTCAARCELLIRYEHSYNEALRIRLSDVNGLATLRLWFEMGEPAPSRQGEELAVAVLHGIIREFLGPTWQPLSVCFSHHAPGDLETHDRVLGPAAAVRARLHRPHPVRAGPRRAERRPPIRPPGPGPRRCSGRWPRRAGPPRPTGCGTWSRCCCRPGAARPTRSPVPSAWTAADPAPPPGRRPARRSPPLWTERRAGLAERYLSTERYRLGEISDLLGFAAPSAFSRWFRQQFGDSPKGWRVRRADLPEVP